MSVAPTSNPPPTILKKPRSSSASHPVRQLTTTTTTTIITLCPRNPTTHKVEFLWPTITRGKDCTVATGNLNWGSSASIFSFTWRYDNKCEPISWAKLVSSMSKFCQKCRGGSSETSASCQSSHNVFGYRISQCNKVCGRHRGAKALAMLERVEGREKRERR